MKKFISKIREQFYIKRVYAIVIIIAAVVYLLYGIRTCKNAVNFHDVGVDYSKGWIDKENNVVDLEKLNEVKGVSIGKEFVIYKKIKRSDVENKEENTLCFMARNVLVTGYIESKKIISTREPKTFLETKSPGTTWHFYEFDDDDAGKVIELHIKTYYTGNSSSIKNMKMYDDLEYVKKFLEMQAPSLVIYIVMFLIAIVFMIAGQLFQSKEENLYELFRGLGFLTISLGLWCTIETDVIQLFWNISSILQCIACGVLYSVGIPIIYVCVNVFNIENRKVCDRLASVIFAINCIAWILHWTGVSDVHESLIICHITLGISAIVLLVTVLKEYREKRQTIDKPKNKVILSMKKIVLVIVCVGLFVDILNFYKGTLGYSISFIQIDMVIVILYCGFIAFNRFTQVDHEIKHDDFVRKLAYMDGLTEVGNRTAFEEKIKDIDKNDEFKKVGIAIFDVNDLKIVNDTYGHTEGDKIIIAVADLLSKAFEENCSVYRVGGDEFAVVITALNSEMIYKVGVMQLRNNIHNYNNFYSSKYKLSVAMGAAFYDSTKDRNINDVLKEADDNMYDDKRRIKKERRKMNCDMEV